MRGLLSASSDPKNKGHESTSQERIETLEDVSLGTNEVSAGNKKNLSHDNANVDSPEQSHASMFSILSSVSEADKLHCVEETAVLTFSTTELKSPRKQKRRERVKLVKWYREELTPSPGVQEEHSGRPKIEYLVRQKIRRVTEMIKELTNVIDDLLTEIEEIRSLCE